MQINVIDNYRANYNVSFRFNRQLKTFHIMIYFTLRKFDIKSEQEI